MITYSGIQVEAIGMKCQGTPTPLDIAVHAGRICRFGGAIWMPLLPHLVLVGLLAYKRSSSVANLLWGFLHDAHETITCDVPKPFKCDCMRQEQAAIDKRLFDLYHGDLNSEVHHSMIDFDLIKECDLIACDLEAVTLRLPGYAELIPSRPPLELSDLRLFQNIQHSPFYTNSIRGLDSAGVCLFASALKFALKGNLTAFVASVHGWDLLGPWRMNGF